MPESLEEDSIALGAAAKSLQSCPTLCDPRDGSLPGSPVPGILQARSLEWVAISFSNVGKRKVKVKSLSCVRLFATPWTAAYQAPPSIGFSRQEYWSGVPLPSPKWLHSIPLNCCMIIHSFLIERHEFLLSFWYKHTYRSLFLFFSKINSSNQHFWAGELKLFAQDFAPPAMGSPRTGTVPESPVGL